MTIAYDLLVSLLMPWTLKFSSNWSWLDVLRYKPISAIKKSVLNHSKLFEGFCSISFLNDSLLFIKCLVEGPVEPVLFNISIALMTAAFKWLFGTFRPLVAFTKGRNSTMPDTCWIPSICLRILEFNAAVLLVSSSCIFSLFWTSDFKFWSSNSKPNLSSYCFCTS